MPRSDSSFLLHSSSDFKRCHYSPLYVVERHRSELWEVEFHEIFQFEKIYYWGQNANKSNLPKINTYPGNFRYVIGDQIEYRYEILSVLGDGVFGQVFKVLDHVSSNLVAVKVIRKDSNFKTHAKKEYMYIKKLNMGEEQSMQNATIVKVFRNFEFRGHYCIIMELLDITLLDFFFESTFTENRLQYVKHLAREIFKAVALLHRMGILHADLKPENILLKLKPGAALPELRVADFGNSCSTSCSSVSLVQTRYYRAPEVFLKHRNSPALDIWSVGCILCEMWTSKLLFPSLNTHDHLWRIVEVLGLPPQFMLTESSGASFQGHFSVSENGVTTIDADGNFMKVVPGSRPLKGILFGDAPPGFLKLVGSCMQWLCEERITAEEALEADFFQTIISNVPGILSDHESSIQQAVPVSTSNRESIPEKIALLKTSDTRKQQKNEPSNLDFDFILNSAPPHDYLKSNSDLINNKSGDLAEISDHTQDDGAVKPDDGTESSSPHTRYIENQRKMYLQEFQSHSRNLSSLLNNGAKNRQIRKSSSAHSESDSKELKKCLSSATDVCERTLVDKDKKNTTRRWLQFLRTPLTKNPDTAERNDVKTLCEVNDNDGNRENSADCCLESQNDQSEKESTSITSEEKEVSK